MSDDHHHMKWLHKYSMDFFDNPLPDNAPPVKGLTARDIRGAFAEYETLRAENERLRYVLEGVRAAILTGRNEPLAIWKDQIDIALETKGTRDE